MLTKADGRRCDTTRHTVHEDAQDVILLMYFNIKRNHQRSGIPKRPLPTISNIAANSPSCTKQHIQMNAAPDYQDQNRSKGS